MAEVLLSCPEDDEVLGDSCLFPLLECWPEDDELEDLMLLGWSEVLP